MENKNGKQIGLYINEELLNHGQRSSGYENDYNEEQTILTNSARQHRKVLSGGV